MIRAHLAAVLVGRVTSLARPYARSSVPARHENNKA